MRRIYLDYAATTPVDPLVKKATESYFCQKFGNPSSLHFFGQEAMAAIDESREKIAKSVGADFGEIIFTGSATEANNLALRGIVKGYRVQGLGFSKNRDAQNSTLNHSGYTLTPRIIVSAIEHESILETVRDLESEAVEVIYLPVNREGVIDLKKLKEALNERTVLVSIMYANNEIGTIQNIPAVAEIIARFKIEKLQNLSTNKKNLLIFQSFNQQYPLLHTDAVQAFQYLDCNVNKLGVDLMTLSAHKIYGPKGVGALYARALSPKPYPLNPIITGGGQEFGFRSGTENTAAIVGFAKAVELVSNSRELENKRIGELSDYFWKQIKKIYPKAQLNGIMNKELRIKNTKKIPNILNVYFPGHGAEELLIKFDLAGVAVSSGSACSARSSKPSHVLKSCGLPENSIKSSLRFSLGRFTTKTEINEAIRRIRKILVDIN